MKYITEIKTPIYEDRIGIIFHNGSKFFNQRFDGEIEAVGIGHEFVGLPDSFPECIDTWVTLGNEAAKELLFVDAPDVEGLLTYHKDSINLLGMLEQTHAIEASITYPCEVQLSRPPVALIDRIYELCNDHTVPLSDRPTAIQCLINEWRWDGRIREDLIDVWRKK